MNNKRIFIVTLEIKAREEESVVKMLEGIINDYRTLSFKIQPYKTPSLKTHERQKD